MVQIASFLGASLASMLEPFTLAGCMLLGSLIGRLWKAIVLASVWVVIIQYGIIQPRVQALGLVYTGEMLAASLLGAWLATALVHIIANAKPVKGE